MRAFLTAIRFLTRITVPGPHGGVGGTGPATLFFPVVGGLIGLLLVGVYQAAELLWQDRAVSSALVIITAALITGGLHLDGFMDTCDGVFGGRSREKALEIMKDSRIGAFGAIGIVCLLLVKFCFLNILPRESIWKVLIFMPSVGRWALVYAVARFPYARQQGTGKAFKDYVKSWHLLAASLLLIGIGAGLFEIRFLPLAAIIWLAVWLQAKYLSSKLGGLTGDTYGFIGEVVEVIFLAVIPLVLQITWI